MSPRPKGSKNKPKEPSPLEEKFEKALDKARRESGIKKPTIEDLEPFNPSKLQEEFDEVFGESKAVYDAPENKNIQDETVYNPFKNPQFRKKMGLKD